MDLDEAREALKSAAITYATGHLDDGATIKALCLAASAYAVVRQRGNPRYQQREATEVVLPFGAEKGMPLTEAKTSNLQWVAGIVQESIDAPDKERWRASNQELLDAIERELATR